MNGIGMYQNYLDSFQGMGQTNGQNGKRAEKKEQKEASSYYKSEAVYERTSTNEEIKKVTERQKNYGRNKVKEDKTDREEFENFTITKKKQEVTLSDKAQKLLEQLKEKYSNMDFFVADFNTDKEAQRYLSQGTKEYSVVIDPETLEQMAADEEIFKKYDDILSNAGSTFDQVKEQLGEDIDKVVSFGMSIDGNGKVNLFAELDKQSVKRAEAQKKQREEKAEQKKEQQKAEEKKEKTEQEKEAVEARRQRRRTFRVTGATIDELVNNIKTAV